RLTRGPGRNTVTTRLFGPELPCLPYRVVNNRVVRENFDRQDELCVLPPDFAQPIGTTLLFPGTPFATQVPLPKFTVLVPTPDTVVDLDEMGLAAGQNIHRIDRVKPAARIVEEMMAEAWEQLEAERVAGVR
ncbi:MAG TPA: nitronate monooxygenase, partial [Thermoanaerobaculia bacterium]|nr:nitronate monooxygenase [Thermoanaerobaculia bacterium]